MAEVAKSAPEGQALRAIIERYLSVGHANSLGTGCPISALGPELARKPLPVRRRIEAALEAYGEQLLPFISGQTREEKLAKCRLLFASMAGVLMMARVISAPQRREQIWSRRVTSLSIPLLKNKDSCRGELRSFFLGWIGDTRRRKQMH